MGEPAELTDDERELVSNIAARIVYAVRADLADPLVTVREYFKAGSDDAQANWIVLAMAQEIVRLSRENGGAS